jgi:hypothetical protein
MPLVFFTTPLPSPVDMPFGGDYLTLLREQWFMLIDPLAAEQHVNWPSRMFKGWVPSEYYVSASTTVRKLTSTLYFHCRLSIELPVPGTAGSTTTYCWYDSTTLLHIV